MADSKVDITAGTGTEIDTRTEGTNGQHRQVVVVGDPATNAGVAPVDATNGLAVDVKQSALPSGAATETTLDAVKTAVEILDNAISGSEMQVDVVSSALPSGAATETTLDAVKTAVEVLDNAISGSEMQVDVVAALPAGSNNIGDVDVASIASGKTRLSAAISAASSGDNTLVAALASNKTKVLGLFLVAAGDVDVRLEDGAAGTALTGVISLTANNGFVLPLAPCPDMHWFETSVNTLLNLELSAAVQVSGALVYYQEA